MIRWRLVKVVQVGEAIYRKGNLKLLGKLHLRDGDRVRVRVEPIDTASQSEDREAVPSDPLEGLRISTGIADLAEHFDDYRFGRRKA